MVSVELHGVATDRLRLCMLQCLMVVTIVLATNDRHHLVDVIAPFLVVANAELIICAGNQHNFRGVLVGVELAAPDGSNVWIPRRGDLSNILSNGVVIIKGRILAKSNEQLGLTNLPA